MRTHEAREGGGRRGLSGRAGLLGVWVALWAGTDVAAAQELQLVSPLGRELVSLPDTAGLVAAAESAAAAHPDSAELLLELGAARAAVWRYREAVEAYTRGVESWPGDPRFLRHRGHRHISLRQFEQAVEDLEAAAALRPEDRSLQFDIWYHLGLARYLLGRFGEAALAYERARDAAADDDGVVAASYWLWLAVSRAGRQEEAVGVLERITADMVVEENTAYHRLLLLFKGELAEADVLPAAGEDALQASTLGYGVVAGRIIAGRTEEARALLREIVRGPYWPAFGFIAAEAELARTEPATPGSP